MTQDEIIEMAQECKLIGMRPHLDGIYSEALVAFAKLVADKALADHAMSKVQRLGQEIEQEPVAWQWLGSAHFRKKLPKNADVTAWNPLYTAPPQRKPLTNGEIYTAYITATNQTLRATDERLAFAFARAIEAAHGIKENT